MLAPLSSFRQRFAGLGPLILLVSAVIFVDDIFFTAITPLLPHYVHVFGLTKSGAGVLVAAYPFGTLLAAIPGGVLASRVGVRRSVIVGLTLMSVATFTFGLAGSIWLLDVARFVQGVGGACTWAGGLAWLTSAAPAGRRAGALGIAFGAAVGGSLVGPIVGVTASSVGTGPTFAGATGAAVCLVVGSLFVRVPGNDKSQSVRSVLLALRDLSLAAGLWLTCLSGLAFGLVDVLVPLRLARLGAGAGVIGAAFFGAAGLEVFLSPLVGRVSDSRGRRLPVRILVTFAVGVSLLLPVAAPAGVLVLVVVVGLSAFGTLFVPAAALTSDGAQRQGLHQGMGFGLANLAWAGGQAVAAAGSGTLSRATSDAVPCAILAAAFACTLVLVSLRRPLRTRLASGAKTAWGRSLDDQACAE